ncbi:uncharacterized protein CCR75_008581 [Bremia lactucae]|uniref:Uncharacterized protein n=1 Tax=Bremia lactucae TaxID=4779 RepID=A0A976P035_BRELC|nr:hypothetical protein CCR75_008581 [Bremia lactucae]
MQRQGGPPGTEPPREIAKVENPWQPLREDEGTYMPEQYAGIKRRMDEESDDSDSNKGTGDRLTEQGLQTEAGHRNDAEKEAKTEINSPPPQEDEDEDEEEEKEPVTESQQDEPPQIVDDQEEEVTFPEMFRHLHEKIKAQRTWTWT